MFSSIRDDIRGQWSRPNSGLQRLILINVAVFLIINLGGLFISSKEAYDYFIRFFAIPVEFDYFIIRPWTFVTSFFTHEGVWHILWNMLYLYWFGMVVREYLGSDRLISLYVLGGLVGSLSILLLFNVVPQFKEAAGGIALGASAGVFAVVVGAATIAPDRTFYLLFFGPVKIKYIAGFFVVMAIFGLKGNNVGGEVAHLSGAFIGYFFIRSLQKGNDIGSWVTSTLIFFKSFFVRQSRMKVNYSRKKETRRSSSSSSRKTTTPGKPSQEEIDAILDKISQSGYESLSKIEKEKLFNASNKSSP